MSVPKPTLAHYVHLNVDMSGLSSFILCAYCFPVAKKDPPKMPEWELPAEKEDGMDVEQMLESPSSSSSTSDDSSYSCKSE